MSDKIQIVIKGNPQSKQRYEFTTKGGKFRTYTPEKTILFENLVKIKAEEQFSQALTGAIKVSIEFYLPRPKYLEWQTKPMPVVFCSKRPDIDNLAKSVIDGLTKIAFKDDGQIADLCLKKFYHASENKKYQTTDIKEPMIIINIQEIE